MIHKEKFAGIQELASNYAITNHEARKAMKAFKMMNADGTPALKEYAQSRRLSNGCTWYLWSISISTEAFAAYGIGKPDRIKAFSHVINGSQAYKKINLAFERIGEICNITKFSEVDEKDVVSAHGTYQKYLERNYEVVGWTNILREINNRSDCAKFIVDSHKELDEYVRTCNYLCTTDHGLEEIFFYEQAIRKILTWIQLQFFR